MKFIQSLIRFTRILAVAGLVAFAVLLSAVRLGLLEANAYRGYVEEYLARSLGEAVRIEKLEGRMRGLRPELSLQSVKVLDAAQRPAIQFQQVRLGLNVVDLITRGEIRSRWVKLVGAQLSIRREADGSFSIAGLNSHQGLPAWLLEDGRFELLDSEVTWQNVKLKGPKIHLTEVDILLVNRGARHRLKIDFAMPKALGQSCKLIFDYRGDLFSPRGWSGRLYAEGSHLRPENFYGDRIYWDYQVSGGTGSIRLWGDWQEGALKKITGAIDFSALTLLPIAAGESNKRPILLEKFGAGFDWRREAQGWRLDVADLNVRMDGQSWPVSHLSIKNEDRGAWQIAAGYVNLRQVSRLLLTSPRLTGEWAQALHKLSLRGELSHFRFSLDSRGEQGPSFAFCGRFHRMGVDAWRGMPAVDNATGAICGNQEQGWLHLAARDMKLTKPGLFRESLQLTLLEGRFDWRQGTDRWIIKSEAIKAKTADLTAYSRFWLEIPEQAGESPFLDMQTHFQGLDLARAKRYFPVAFLPKRTVAWFDRALVAGTVKQGGALFYGHFKDFPFAERMGIFEVLFEAEKVTLDYGSAWPPLTGATVHSFVYNRYVEVKATQGMIGGAPIDRIRAEIAAIGSSDYLHVQGEARSKLMAAARLLQKTPLRSSIDTLFDYVKVAGEGRLALDLRIPLVPHSEGVLVDGLVELEQSRLQIIDLGLEIESIRGQLKIDQDGMQAEALQAFILGFPARIAMAREQTDYRIQIHGRAGSAALKAQFPHQAWDFIEGEADYRLMLHLPQLFKGPLKAQIDLTSDLKGMAVRLPAPLAKAKDSVQTVSLALALQKSAPIPVNLHYGEAVFAELVFAENVLEKAVLSFGQAPPRTGEKAWAIVGRLDEVPLAQWLDVLAAGGQLPGRLPAIDLAISHVNWQGRDLGELSIQLQRDGKSWIGAIDCPYAKGRLKIPLKPSAALWEGAFEFLNLTGLAAEGNAEIQPLNVDPRKLPALKIKSEHFFWQQVDYGVLEMKARPSEQGLQVDQLSIRSDNHRLQISGAWLKNGAMELTQWRGKIESDNLGLMLARLAKTKELNGTPSQVEFSLDWSGAPYRFAVNNLQGKVKFTLGKGRLLGVEPGVGRALGLFNLDTLQRRLMLDFSDLFGKGLAYDSVKGACKIIDGQVKIDQFYIDAVPARIYITGWVDLVTQELDQLVTVIPKTTATLPIAGALAGGPVVGAAIFVAQKLFGKQVDKVASTQYQVLGRWDDPAVIRLKQNVPMELFHKAWEGLKDLSGLGSDEEKHGE